MKVFELTLGGQTYRPAIDLNASILMKRECGIALPELLAKLRSEDSDNTDRVDAMRTLIWASLATDCGKRKLPHPSIIEVGCFLETDMDSIASAFEKLGGREFEGQLAPFVPTPMPVVKAMIETAELKPGMHVVDLGAGDGRLLIAAVESAENVTAKGYEAHPGRYAKLDETLAAHSKATCFSVSSEDARNASIGNADVVFLYLLPSSNAELKAKLLKEMKPGAVVVSHDFNMPEWPPETVETVKDGKRTHTVYSWRIPG